MELTINLKPELVWNLLVNAIDCGAISYWCQEVTIKLNGKFIGTAALTDDNILDCIFTFTENDEGCNAVHTMNGDDMVKGLKSMAEGTDGQCSPRHFAAIIDGNDDAETADVFVQMTLWGEIVYG